MKIVQLQLKSERRKLYFLVFVSLNMKKYKLIALAPLLLFFVMSCQGQAHKKTIIMDSTNKENNPVYSRTDSSKVVMSDAEWKKILSPEVYEIARKKGTEMPFSSKYETSTEIGTYYCAACGNPLFKSDTKFESGCGWPSFYEPVSKSSIIYAPDHSHGMDRTEVMCGRCKAHLGHVFNDGPPPTGLRYCINGVVLDFEKAKAAEKKYNSQ